MEPLAAEIERPALRRRDGERAPAAPLARFDDRDRYAALDEPPRRGDPGCSGADDRDIVVGVASAHELAEDSELYPRRPPGQPLRRLLVSPADAQGSRLVIRLADDMQRGRQALRGEAV